MTADEPFDSMFRDSYGIVLHYCTRRVPGAAAQDAVAEVFSIAWRRRSRLPDDPMPWLIATARRVLANQGRSERRRVRLLDRAGRHKEHPPPTIGGSPAVEAALARLAPTDAEIVRLAYWDELTHQQIGEVLGLSTNAIGVRLHRARARLKADLINNTAEETAPCDSPT